MAETEPRRFALRRSTSNTWEAVNPILADGEEGYDKTTRKRKVGDGTTPWSSLPWDVAVADPSQTPATVTSEDPAPLAVGPDGPYPMTTDAFLELIHAVKGPIATQTVNLEPDGGLEYGTQGLRLSDNYRVPPTLGVLNVIVQQGNAWPAQSANKGISRWCGSADLSGPNDVAPLYIREFDEHVKPSSSLTPTYGNPNSEDTFSPGAITGTGTHNFASQTIPPQTPIGATALMAFFIPINTPGVTYKATILSTPSEVMTEWMTPVLDTNMTVVYFKFTVKAEHRSSLVSVQAVNTSDGTNATTASAAGQIIGAFFVDLPSAVPDVRTTGPRVGSSNNRVTPSATPTKSVMEISFLYGSGSASQANSFDHSTIPPELVLLESKVRSGSTSAPWPFIQMFINPVPTKNAIGGKLILYKTATDAAATVSSGMETIGLPVKTTVLTRLFRENGAWVIPPAGV